MAEYEPWEMKLAWQEAWQLRGCPPDAVLLAEKPSRELQRHLTGCIFCTEALEEKDAGTSPPPIPSPAIPGTEHPSQDGKEPGQVWSLRPGLAGWGPGERYYNPPMVMIVSRLKTPVGAIRVAQVHHDSLLAGPGDVPLVEGLFAEAWNTYTLSEDDLQAHLLSVNDTTLQEVLKTAQKGFSRLPQGSSQWLEAFRRLEVEVAAFFAMKALERLLTRSAREGLSFSPALPPFLEQELPLAAAEEENRIIVNRIHWKAGMARLNLVPAELTLWKAAHDSLTLGGHLKDAVPEGTKMFAWWWTGDCREFLDLLFDGGDLDWRAGTGSGELKHPQADIDFSSEGGYFRVYFHPLGKEVIREGRLVLLICEQPEEDQWIPEDQ